MARSFQTSNTAVMSTDKMTERFENMLSRVDKMIQQNNIYSVWVRLAIGKSDKNKLIFDTSSRDPDENLFLSLDYKKVGAGVGNEFTFKIAFDLFNYGQETKKNVEMLDELIYKALNINDYKNATDSFYCNFQYGYNIVGDTQIVSPFYEGLITDIVPSIDYTNGKTYYTITGVSFITNASLKYSYEEVKSTNGLEVIKNTLWYYHGNPNQTGLGGDYTGKEQHPDATANPRISATFNIDIPDDLMKSASKVSMEAKSDMTPIDYCKEILSQTVNTSDSRYNGDDESPGYDLKDGDFKPYYILYLTDSGGQGVPTVHVAYVGSNGDLKSMQGIKTVSFNFEWFTRDNNIVIGWKPQVNLKAYFLARAEMEHQRTALEAELQLVENVKDKVDTSGINGLIDSGQDWLNKLGFGKTWLGSQINSIVDAFQSTVLDSSKIQASLQSIIDGYQEKIDALSDMSNIEYYKSTLTLVGIPSDIPLNILLEIHPKIFESVSRTQGQYYVLGATDKINTNGLYTTEIELLRYKNS